MGLFRSGFMEISKNFWGDILSGAAAKGGHGGQENLLILNEVDACSALQGLGVSSWRRVRRVRRVGGWFERFSTCGWADGKQGIDIFHAAVG